MIKSIYDEVLDILDNILVDSFSDPQDEYNDCYMLNFKQIIKIEKVIKKAQKQEKLLVLYKELSAIRDDMLSFCEVADNGYYGIKHIETHFINKIKESEGE